MQTNDSIPNNKTEHLSMKSCSECGVERAVSMFSIDRSRGDGLDAYCKKCRAERTRKHREDNSITIAAKKRDYYLKNRTKILEKDRKYRLANKERIAQRDRDYYIDNKNKRSVYYREWVDKNRDKVRTISRNRRAREAASGGTITAAEWQSVLDRFDGKCAKCGSPESIHMDHVVPLAKGGRHDVSNVQPLCQTCNLRKGVKIEDYRGKMYRPLSLLIDGDAA